MQNSSLLKKLKETEDELRNLSLKNRQLIEEKNKMKN
jgi:hypothetical protein